MVPIFEEMRQTCKDVELVVLTRNYRSSQPILNTFNELISQDKDRLHSKRLILDDEVAATLDSIKPQIVGLSDSKEEALWVSNQIKSLVDQGMAVNDIAILLRSTGSAEALMKELERILEPNGLKVVQFGGKTVLETSEAELCMTILKMLRFPRKNLFITGLIRKYHPFIGPKALTTAIEMAESTNTSLYNVLLEHKNGQGQGFSKLAPFLDMIEVSRNALEKNPKVFIPSSKF